MSDILAYICRLFFSRRYIELPKLLGQGSYAGRFVEFFTNNTEISKNYRRSVHVYLL